jgi:hypothetical protein
MSYLTVSSGMSKPTPMIELLGPLISVQCMPQHNVRMRLHSETRPKKGLQHARARPPNRRARSPGKNVNQVKRTDSSQFYRSVLAVQNTDWSSSRVCTVHGTGKPQCPGETTGRHG